MDFLRRLDPGRSAAPGAARLDLAPRWLEPAAPLVDAEATAPVDTVAPLRVAAVRAPARRQPGPLDLLARSDPDPPPAHAVRAPAPTPAVAAHVGFVATARLPDRVPYPAAPSARQQAESITPRSAPLDRAVPPEADPARAVVPVEPKLPAAPSLPPSAGPVSAHVPHDGPLRLDALAERRPPAGGAPPIVHVTIDRIDVRLPAASAPTAQSERRPRPSGAVAPLADYLRGGGRA